MEIKTIKYFKEINPRFKNIAVDEYTKMVLDTFSVYAEVSPSELLKCKTRKQEMIIKDLFIHISLNRIKINASSIARILGISRTAVFQTKSKGLTHLDEDADSFMTWMKKNYSPLYNLLKRRYASKDN